jgi:hypothetical protein
MLRICIVLFIFITVSNPVLAGNESMNVQDIIDVEPSLPFGGGLLSMVFGLIKWGAIAGFIAGLFIIIGKGAVATAMDHADMSEKAQNNLFLLAKIVMLGTFVFLLGCYVFETYL